MKKRISHFITKNLEITEITRPSPDRLRDIGARLQSDKLDKPQPRKLSKAATERHSLQIESRYAGTPVAPKSEIIQQIIKQEAEIFRELRKNGRPQKRSASFRRDPKKISRQS